MPGIVSPATISTSVHRLAALGAACLLSTAALSAVSAGVLAAPAAAAPLISLAPLTQYNSTPDCPVSAAKPVCGPWNVPVDLASLFGALDYGQCPYWASVKYPSLVTNEDANDPLGTNWDGGTWAEHASEEGLPVTATPAPGDLAVWAQTSSDPSGHIAFVEAVESDGSVIVSQMDGNTALSSLFPPLEGTTEYLTPSDLAYYRSSYNLQYIDTGDTDTGTPTSYVQLPQAEETTSASTTTPQAVSSSTKEQRPLTVHYKLRGRQLTVSAVAANGGSVRTVATSGRATTRLASSWYGQNYTFSGRLARGSWTVKVTDKASGSSDSDTLRIKVRS
jgi:surface antigen